MIDRCQKVMQFLVSDAILSKPACTFERLSFLLLKLVLSGFRGNEKPLVPLTLLPQGVSFLCLVMRRLAR